MRFVSVQAPHSTHTASRASALKPIESEEAAHQQGCLLKRRGMGAPTYRADDLNTGAGVFWLEQVSEAANVLSKSQAANQFRGNTGAAKTSFEPTFELPVVRAPAFNLDAPHGRPLLRGKNKYVLPRSPVLIFHLLA